MLDMITKSNVEVISEMPVEDLKHIVEVVENKSLDKLESIGSGSYSSVFGYKGYAIKQLYSTYEFGDDTDENNDVQALRDLSHLDCVPKIYAVIDNHTMIVERIRGLTVRAVCKDGDNNDKIKLDDNFKQKFDDDLVDIMISGYSPDDVHESNVIIEEDTNKPKIIDLGWFKKHNLDENEPAEVLKRKVKGYNDAQIWAGSAINQYLDNMNR